MPNKFDNLVDANQFFVDNDASIAYKTDRQGKHIVNAKIKGIPEDDPSTTITVTIKSTNFLANFLDAANSLYDQAQARGIMLHEDFTPVGE